MGPRHFDVFSPTLSEGLIRGGVSRDVKGWSTSPEVRLPINLKLGRQRVKLGYEIRRPDGTTILAPAIPGLGFHGSLHPTGLIKISDNFGFDKRFDLSSPELLARAKPALEAFVEDLIASMEVGLEIDEDVIALLNPELMGRRLFRRTRHGLDIDPFAAIRARGVEFPFLLVEHEAIPEFLRSYATVPTALVAPESHRFLFAADPSNAVSFEFDFEHPMEFVRRFPFGDQIVETLEESIDYLGALPPTAGIEPLGFLRTQFENLDQEQLTADIMDVLGGTGPPALRRFTLKGFQPL